MKAFKKLDLPSHVIDSDVELLVWASKIYNSFFFSYYYFFRKDISNTPSSQKAHIRCLCV